MKECKGSEHWDCRGDYRGLFLPKFVGLGKEYCNQCGKPILNNKKDQGDEKTS